MPRSEPLMVMFHDRCLGHVPMDREHPETSDRLRGVMSRIMGHGLVIAEPMPCPRKALRRFHDESYLMRFEEACLAGRSHLGHPDNQICYESFEAATIAAGTGIDGVALLEGGKAEKVFCAVRPPGHHAESAVALGFCFLNNVVIAARHWQEAYGREKILIIDFDAHHGNGIQAAAEMFEGLFYVSLHEHPTFSFPGTGYAEETNLGGSKGWILNIPFPPGTGDEKVMGAMEAAVLPAVKRFGPEAVIIAAGFDGHEYDDMSGLRYTTSLFGRLGGLVAKLAGEYCGGKVLSLLEGGYHPLALAESVECYLACLTTMDKTCKRGTPSCS